MLCRHPYVKDRKGECFASPHPRDWLAGVPFRCGKCLACRVAIRREWTTRLILEMLNHDRGAFVTLTYSEDYCPVTDTGFRTLLLKDLQNFMKRLRINLERIKGRKYPIRFYACGEYGVRFTERPHYHIIIFGASNSDPDFIKAVQFAWSAPVQPGKHGRQGDTPMLGNVKIDPLNAKTIAYTAGYIAKKFINPKKCHKVITSSVEVGGRRITFDKRVVDRANSRADERGIVAEFRVMSRMPGLGSGVLGRFVALARSSTAFRDVLLSSGDVPSVVRAFGRVLFLDRFLKAKLREILNVEPDPTAYFAELRSGFFDWLNNPTLSHATDYYDYLVSLDDQRYKQLEAKVKRQISASRKF